MRITDSYIKKNLTTNAISHGPQISIDSCLGLSDRKDIYQNFLLYCRNSDVVKLGLGSTIALEFDRQEFIKIEQLQKILGLNNLDVACAHHSIAEQAYRTEVEQMRMGPNARKSINHEMTRLTGLQKRLGLSDDNVHKIIEEVFRKETKHYG